MGKSPRGSSTTSIDERTGAPIVASEMPYRLQNLRLTFGGRAAVAAHCGDDERMRAACLHVIAGSRDDQREVVDAAAAGGDRDRGARPESRSSSAASCDRSVLCGSFRRARSNRCLTLKSRNSPHEALQV